jgi:hypothetical protein
VGKKRLWIAKAFDARNLTLLCCSSGQRSMVSVLAQDGQNYAGMNGERKQPLALELHDKVNVAALPILGGLCALSLLGYCEAAKVTFSHAKYVMHLPESCFSYVVWIFSWCVVPYYVVCKPKRSLLRSTKPLGYPQN